MYQKIKPVFDRTGSLILLAVFMPLIIIITIVNTIVTGGRPFFLHQRSGQFGKPIRIIKFRTLKDRNSNGEIIKELTGIGGFLRRSSIDELPQLLNVLFGSMSLVGPRPLLMEYVPLYSAEQRRRLLVKPGITGWAQVNGRNAIPWDDRFALDTWYVGHMSFQLDVKILILTIKKVITADGARYKGQTLCPKFKATQS